MNMFAKISAHRCSLLASVLVVSLGLGLPGLSAAGRINGTILEVTQDENPDGVPSMLVITSSTEIAQPACHVAGERRMLVDLRTENGRAMAVLITAAAFGGKTIRINGTASCSVHPQIETADFAVVSF
jgi:hypothetical protein